LTAETVGQFAVAVVAQDRRLLDRRFVAVAQPRRVVRHRAVVLAEHVPEVLHAHRVPLLADRCCTTARRRVLGQFEGRNVS